MFILTSNSEQTLPVPVFQDPLVRRILVVDDNVDAAESLAFLLRFLGHEVQTAYHSSSALAKAQQFEPDFILLDIGLPGMSGYDLAPLLRALPGLADVQLIAVSGFQAQQDDPRCQAACFRAHLTKPTDFEDLKALLTV